MAPQALTAGLRPRPARGSGRSLGCGSIGWAGVPSSDSRTRQVVEITPAGRGVLRMYSCGPDGSRRAHIGDLRSYLIGDLIRRNAEHRHHLTVLTCQNISDVDHPADGGAVDPAAADAFRADCSALNLRPAENSPRSSESAGLVTGMLEGLAQAGWAAPGGQGPSDRAAECAALSLHFLGEDIDVTQVRPHRTWNRNGPWRTRPPGTRWSGTGSTGSRCGSTVPRWRSPPGTR